MSAVLQIVEKTKVCSKCEQSKALTEFHLNSNFRDGRLKKCKSCVKEEVAKTRKNLGYMKKWREAQMADPVKHARMKERKNNWNRTEKYYEMYYQKRFGVSYKTLVSMLSVQNGLCANVGCSKSIVMPPSEGDRACVDHSHVTGKVRAILCIRCNTTLGHIENDKRIVLGLMDYLNKHA